MSFLQMHVQIKEMQEKLQEMKRTVYETEHDLYTDITSDDLKELEELCRGKGPHEVSFQYKIAFVPGEGIFVDTDEGYWKLSDKKEWVRAD